MLHKNLDQVIFVDIDGPLLPARMHYNDANKTFIFNLDRVGKVHAEIRANVVFDPTMVFVLNSWIKLTSAKIVVSSAWTKYCSKKELEDLFKKNKIVFEFHEDWCTEKNPSAKETRGDEIARWLSYNRNTISNYLVLDDDHTVLSSPSIKKDRVLLIDFLNGLTWKQIFEGCEILGITDYDNLVKM